MRCSCVCGGGFGEGCGYVGECEVCGKLCVWHMGVYGKGVHVGSPSHIPAMAHSPWCQQQQALMAHGGHAAYRQHITLHKSQNLHTATEGKARLPALSHKTPHGSSITLRTRLELAA